MSLCLICLWFKIVHIRMWINLFSVLCDLSWTLNLKKNCIHTARMFIGNWFGIIYFFFGFFTDSAVDDFVSAFFAFACSSKLRIASTTCSKKNAPDILIIRQIMILFRKKMNSSICRCTVVFFRKWLGGYLGANLFLLTIFLKISVSLLIKWTSFRFNFFNYFAISRVNTEIYFTCLTIWTTKFSVWNFLLDFNDVRLFSFFFYKVVARVR